jgi:hypothetical protein
MYVYGNTFTHTNADPPNRYSDYAGTGFRINGDTTYVTFDSNHFDNNDFNGFQFSQSSTIDSLAFVNNTFIGNGAASIDSFDGANLQWTNNTVSGNGTNRVLTSRGFSGNPAPTLTMNWPASVMQNTPSSFSFTTSEALSHVLWDFDDGLPVTSQSASHTFAAAGIYNVSVVAWDLTGRAAFATRQFTVASPGDFNVDGRVDAADYVVWRKGLGTIYTSSDINMWRAHFGETASLPGDFNVDGRIDAADYVVWRKTDGSVDDYNTWCANFGRTLRTGAGFGAAGFAGASAEARSPAVPEPAGAVLLMFAAASRCFRRRRAA